MQTLIIASLASAAASFAASRIWGAGTLISAAATPVVVALVSEFLRRPVQTVAATAKKVPTGRSLPAVRERAGAAPEDPTRVSEDPTRVTADPAIPAGPHSPSELPPPRSRVEPPAATTPVADPVTIEDAEADGWHPRWRLAVITGLVAFAIVVAVYTVPELLAGRSVTGNGQPTTFFGGSANVKKEASPSKTVTTTTPTTTVTKTAPTTTTTTTKTTTASTSTVKTTGPASTTTSTASSVPPAVGVTPTTSTTPVP